MTDDGLSGTKIVYNLLDLPEKIHAAGNANENIRYIYSAGGEKLASVVGSSVTYYRSVFTYSKSGTGAEQLQYVLHPEGLVAKTNNTWEYRYFKRDHVGSTRVVLAARSGRLDAVQSTDYYPFGMAHGSLNELHLNRYLYGGKEYQDAVIGGQMLGLYDFHARYYNPMLGRWFNQDPRLQTTNPYLYCGNLPMMYTDPDGEFFWIAAAVVAGYMNWFSNGAEVSWKGLGYFGVGAASSALSFGIGAGMNVAMAGGSFSAGFWGTAAAKGISSTGFLAGAATGASAGFAGGFMISSGNAWLGGAGFSNGMWSGFKAGGIAGLSGGVTGGLFGGFDALSKGTNFWNGKSTFDLSKAYGARGLAIGDKTVTGKYVGEFEGVNLYESKMMAENSAAALPGRGIVLAEGIHTKHGNAPWAMQLKQHEFGHILQAKKVGNRAFYQVIAKESLGSATLDMVTNSAWNHDSFWTEKWANYLSHNYFGDRSLLGSWPRQDVSRFNWLRLMHVKYGLNLLR